MYDQVPSFEIPADTFTRLSVFDSPKGLSNTLKNCKDINLYFKRRHLITYEYFGHLRRDACLKIKDKVKRVYQKQNFI